MTWELIEYIGALGEVIGQFATLADCQDVARILFFERDELSDFACEVL